MRFQQGRYNPHLLPKFRSAQIMSAMGNYPCTLRISTFVPGHKCAHQSTVVGCHVPAGGKGMGTKESDVPLVVAGCLHCHMLLDGVDERWEWLMKNYPRAVMERVISAIWETQTLLILDRKVIVPDAITVKGMAGVRAIG